VEALLHRSTERARVGDLAGARADIEKALSLDPQASLFLRRATIRALQKDLEGAVGDCTEAIRLKPDYAEAHLRRGIANMERKEPRQAAADFERALEMSPPNWPQRRQVEEFLRQARAAAPK
jgi:tetratricopeptide (TPR) repeat protein